MDPELDKKLKAELPGILAWLVRGAMQWYANGLGVCAAVTTATGEYKAEMDRVGSFIEDTYVIERLDDGSPNSAHKIKASEVYQDYERWCRENGVDALSMNALSRELGKPPDKLPVILSTGRWRGGIRRPAAADYEKGGVIFERNRRQIAPAASSEQLADHGDCTYEVPF
jgi:putative DNA primase/helicase